MGHLCGWLRRLHHQRWTEDDQDDDDHDKRQETERQDVVPGKLELSDEEEQLLFENE